MPRLKIKVNTYLVFLFTLMLLTIQEVAYSRELDNEIKGLVVGAWASITLLQMQAGVLRQVQILNDENQEQLDTKSVWKGIFKNSFIGLVCGWFTYLGLANGLPVSGVVLSTFIAGYAPTLIIEKFIEFWKRGKE